MFENKSLEAHTNNRVTTKRVVVGDGKQRVHSSTIAHLDFRRLDKALAHVRMPRQKPSNENDINKQVEIPTRSTRVDSKAAAKIGNIHEAALMMREHGPEATQSLGRQTRAEGWNIALEIRSNKVPSPAQTRALALCRITFGETASPPERIERSGAGLAELQRSQLEVRDAPRERFARLSETIEPSRAKQQVQATHSTSAARLVNEPPQHREKPGCPVHFIDDHKLVAVRDPKALRVSEARQIGR